MSAWRVTRISKYIGGWEENKLWKHSGCWQHSWIMIEPGLGPRGEDTQITTSCSGRTLLSREKRHDYFKHSLPSGLWERKETLSSLCCMSLKCSSPRQIFKTHKIIPGRFVTGVYHQSLSCRFPFSPWVSGSWWPRHILGDHLCCPQLPLTL